MRNHLAASSPFHGRKRLNDPSGARSVELRSEIMIEQSPMRRRDEDSPPCFGASIAGACGEAARSAPAEGLPIVLRHLREAAGAERAFLLEAARPPEPTRLVAASTSRADVPGAFSSSVAARALRGDRPLFFADIRRDPVWTQGHSVRGLALRTALAAPLPAYGGPRGAVVVDSRAPLPIDGAAACELVRAFADLIALLRRAEPREPTPPDAPVAGPVGRSPAFLRLQEEILRAARVPLPALVVGESGTGKELVARSLHENGPRNRKPFVAINCAAIPETLLERELFGATRGAFTGADRDHPGLFRQADGGTVFLDEIGDMPLGSQAKLLRVLQEGSVRAVGALEERAINVRVVAATHRDLGVEVAERRFRADLRFRLEVLVLRVPPLRERTGDLPALARHMLERLAGRCGLGPADLSPDAALRLAAYPWPGNVRELESVLARALVRSGGGVIRAEDLDGVSPSEVRTSGIVGAGSRGLETAMIEDALRAARGNVTAAALRIGWSRQALYRRIHALGLKEARVAGDAQDSSTAGGTRSSQSSTFQ
jgi:two-component system NtrC family response regulator